MPQTPQYQQQTRVSGGPLGAEPPGDQGAGALIAAGRAISEDARRVEAFQQQQVENAALVSANEDLQGARSTWAEQMAKRKLDAPPGAPGFTQQALEDFDQDAKDRIARAKTEHAREQLRSRLADLRLSIQEDASSFEIGAGTREKVDKLDRSVESARTAANFRPQDFDQIHAEVLTAIAGSGLTDEQRVEMAQKASNSLAEAAVEGMIQKNPYAALKELNDEKSKSTAIQGLSLDQRQHARSMAQSEINRLEAKARANREEARDALRTDREDAFAARALGLPAKLPGRDQYLAAYGADGGDQYAHDARRWEIYDVAGEAAYQTPQDAAKTLDRLKPKQQAGAAEGTQNYVAAVQLYERQRTALEQNPVAVLESRDPQLQALHNAAAADPQAVPAYFSKLTAQQRALGIATPKLLPDDKRAEIANALVFDPTHPSNRTATLQGLRHAYGDYYVDVMREVAPKLDGLGRVLIGMAPSDAERLDAAYAQKEALSKNVPAKLTSEIEDSVRTELAGFASTLADNPDGPARYAENFEASKLYAQSMVANGASPQAAAKAASDAVINSQYKYKDGMRIPAEFNENHITSALDVKKADLAKSGTFVIDNLKFSTPEAAQADMRNVIDRQGYWITNENGTGVVLRIPHRSGQGEVYTKDGKRVEFSFADLAAMNLSSVVIQPEPYPGY